MNGFSTTSLTPSTLDPHKRVNYSLGLVLGVDEFLQEQTYLMEGDRLHNRLLHGYGTVCGLQVAERDGEAGKEIWVEPGLAVDPQGQTIHVPNCQYVKLNDWLAQAKNREAIEDTFGTSPGSVELFVTLCYRECRTDTVPIPGSPCRTEQDSTKPSRIADNFELKLMVKEPDQPEEKLVNDFGKLLSLIQIDETAPNFIDKEDLANLVRALPDGAPISPLDSPLPDPLYLDPVTACEDLQHAMHVWVTEVRSCDWSVAGQRCVLLARVSFNVVAHGENLIVDVNSDDLSPPKAVVEVDDETERPLLLHTRLLHEWIVSGHNASMILHDHDTDYAALVHDHPHDHPHNHDTDYATLVHDHPHNHDTDYATVGHDHAVGGDLSGNFANLRVDSIQGFNIMMRPSRFRPQDGQQLTWIARNKRWEPAAAGGSLTLSSDTISFEGLGPSQTVYSESKLIQLEINQQPLITVAVTQLVVDGALVNAENPPPYEPSEGYPNVALTVYFVKIEEGDAFRVAATNISQQDIELLEVQWSMAEV